MGGVGVCGWGRRMWVGVGMCGWGRRVWGQGRVDGRVDVVDACL